VVHAWQFGSLGAPGIERSLGYELDRFRVAAEVALDATVREAIPDVGDVEIERRWWRGRRRRFSWGNPLAPICW
jgi:hypothetical protein